MAIHREGKGHPGKRGKPLEEPEGEPKDGGELSETGEGNSVSEAEDQTADEKAQEETDPVNDGSSDGL